MLFDYVPAKERIFANLRENIEMMLLCRILGISALLAWISDGIDEANARAIREIRRCELEEARRTGHIETLPVQMGEPTLCASLRPSSAFAHRTSLAVSQPHSPGRN